MNAATYDWGRVIRAISPDAHPEFVASFARYGEAFRTSVGGNVEVMAGMLAQAAHETQGFRRFEENLTYTTPARIKAVWPRRFPTVVSATPFVRNPRGLANKVYNGRMGNRMDSDDGWDFRGVGAFHHTGREEHEKRARALSMSVAEFGAAMRDPRRADIIMAAALSYARERGVITAMMNGQHTRASELINGGRIGLAERLELTAKARAALAGLPAPPPAPMTTRPTLPVGGKNASAGTAAPPPPDAASPEPPVARREGWLARFIRGLRGR